MKFIIFFIYEYTFLFKVSFYRALTFIIFLDFMKGMYHCRLAWMYLQQIYKVNEWFTSIRVSQLSTNIILGFLAVQIMSVMFY